MLQYYFYTTIINTIEPNVGLVNVPDQRLDQLGVINKSVKVVPAVVSNTLLLQDTLIYSYPHTYHLLFSLYVYIII